jgi:23S rRNA (cytidine1920-2'-O)/16S rRNA (cytidine1409-2'-O)-methyltransferase
MAKKRERLDKLLVARGLAETRSRAQAYIMAGEVRVDGEVATKAGMKVDVAAALDVETPLPYASRGGFKLAAALDAFGIEIEGRVAADVGACTGGFTDVLLQRGAARVFAIDVGYGQLDWQVRQDERVTVMERTNARYLEELAAPVSFVCIDVSFISLRKILPAVQKWVVAQYDVVALVKPQFEAGREAVGKGGIVRDSETHRRVLFEMVKWCREAGLAPAGLIRSPITGTGGNVEFLLWLRPAPGPAFDATAVIDDVVAG